MELTNRETAPGIPVAESAKNIEIRQKLEKRYNYLLEKVGAGEALKLRETEQWQHCFPVPDGTIDAEYFQLLSGQIDHLAANAGTAIARSPFAFAKYLVGLRRPNGRAYTHLAHITRSIIHQIGCDIAEHKIALNLAAENYNCYGVDVKRDLLIAFFNGCQAHVCRFFQTAMTGNVKVFHMFADDLIGDPDSFKSFEPSGLFRFLTLAYVLLDRERFDAVLHIVRDNPSGEAVPHRPGAAVDGIARVFLEECAATGASPAIVSATRQKLKIAVCISGQLRGYAEAFRTWKHLGLEEHSVRYYIHTWNDIGWRFPDPISGNGVFRVFRHRAFVEAYRRAGFLFGRERLVQAYPHLFDAVTVSAEASEEHIRAVYGPDAQLVIEDHQRPEFFDDPQHQFKMFYKIREAHHLMERDGEDFDLVIRIRPDRAFRAPRAGEAKPDWTAIWQRCLNGKTIFFNHLIVTDTIHAGDQFAVGAPEAMAAYAGTLDIQRQASAERWFEMPRRLRPHVSLGHALFLQGIRREALEGIYPVDPAPAAQLGLREIRAMLALDMPDGPQSEMDKLLWYSVNK